MYHLKMEKQRKPLVGNKNSLQLTQPQVNMQATPGKATTTLGRKHP
jgi:hypothetical protein